MLPILLSGRLRQLANMLTVVTDGKAFLILVALPFEVQSLRSFLTFRLYLRIILQHFHFVVFFDDLECFLASLQLYLIVMLFSFRNCLQIVGHCLEAAQVLLLQLFDLL